MRPGKSVLVSGGAGFLGSHLCARLIFMGCRVICLDNLTSGSLSNVAELLKGPDFSFLNHDICNPLDLPTEIDQIFNLACPASPPIYQKDPVQTLKTSVLGTLNMLELARCCGAKLFHASSSEIYGDPLIHPQSEAYLGNVNPIGVRACYDEGKRTAETLIYDYQRLFGLNVRVARIFNTYGPGMDVADGRVVSNFIVQALQGRDLTLYGDGTQTRSFCYRDDLVDGILRLMDAPDEISFPVNIGNDAEFTILQLAEMVIHLTGSTSSIRYSQLPEDDPQQRRPDLSRAERNLGWRPRIDLREGLTRTIRYFRTRTESSGLCQAVGSALPLCPERTGG